MTPEYTNQLAIQLLLSSFSGVLAIGIFFLFLAFLYLRRRPLLSQAKRREGEIAAAAPYHPSVFEQACRWVCIKSTHVEAVQLALHLHNPVPCSWCEGLSRLSEHKLFVSPPIRGWILVVGPGLPDPSADVDRCFVFLQQLSRVFNHLQFFSVDRALNHHAWVRVDGGRFRRAYAWAGETLWNQGKPTAAEVELGLKCLEYGEVAFGGAAGSPEGATPNSERIMALAARWSFDPSAVTERTLHAGLGVAGDLAPSQRH
jgi:hypothetical protein